MNQVVTTEWLAGFFDGEGCVRLQRHSQKYPNYYAVIFLVQKDLAILEQIQQQFGGQLRKKWAKSSCSCLQWNGPSALALAAKLAPVSRCKREQLLVLLEALKLPPAERGPAAERLKAMKKEIKLAA